MARNNYRKRTRKISNNASVSLHPALENLKERLSSPRLKAASTISTYLETSARFLCGLGNDRKPTDTDFRRYFVRRRKQGISERTLRKEFFHLKKLALANSWPWPFEAEGTSAMIPPTRTRTKASPTANKAVSRLHPALEKLVERLSSPQLKARGTISSYVLTAKRFLAWVNLTGTPTESDFRRYFIKRRREGIDEGTLGKEFFHLQKLALANKWAWPFGRDDIPHPKEQRKLPVLERAEVEQLIRAESKLSKAERFYLAVATTWIVRREELSRIKKRDYDSETFIIHTAKQSKRAKHLIPDALKPIFADYRPKEHNPSALSLVFRRICTKAGLQHQPGWGWHGIEYRLTALLKDEYMPENGLNPSLLNDYAHWKQSAGSRHVETDMTEDYRHPEILDTDPFGLDKVIYSIHPFLSLWQKKF